MASSIGLIRCNSYDEKDVKDAIKAITTPFSEENKGKIAGKKIAVYFDFPAPDVQIVREVINYLKKEGASKITVGTSLFTGQEDLARFKALFNEMGVEFVNFRESQYEKLVVPLMKEKTPEHFRGYGLISPVQYSREKQYDKMGIKGKRILKYSFLPIILTDSDYIVPVLKLKVSPVTGLGGVVSSVLNTVPTMTRNQILINKLKYQLERSLLEAYALIKDRILFGVIDGVYSDISEDEEINKMNVILFGEDGLALDSVSSVLVGYRSRDIKTNKIGDDIGLGSGLFSHLSMYGDSFLDFRKEVKNRLKFRAGVKKIPRVIDQNKEVIAKLEQLCPTGAIKLKNGEYQIDRATCISCMFCVQIAPGLFKI